MSGCRSVLADLFWAGSADDHGCDGGTRCEPREGDIHLAQSPFSSERSERLKLIEVRTQQIVLSEVAEARTIGSRAGRVLAGE